MTVRGHLWEFPERTFVFLFLFSEKIMHDISYICIISTIAKIAAELEIQRSTVALIKRKRENRKNLNAKLQWYVLTCEYTQLFILKCSYQTRILKK